ncbi:MAG: hypothetical protein ACI8UO_002579 [Verrucomicrobiales bacterium]|jgi:hypothetical protein
MPEQNALGTVPEDSNLALHWLMPLHFFYERRGLELPGLDFIDGAEMRDGDQQLLVHENDMTPTLTEHHGTELGIQVLDKEVSEAMILRLVILRRHDNLLPVECGAIAIHLEHFEPEVRELIRDCQIPLGGILQTHEIPHYGRPRGFFQLEADELIANALGEDVGQVLSGRCNELCNPEGFALADVVEILPQTRVVS